MKNILIVFLLTITTSVFSQESESQYEYYVEKADSLYNIENYKASALAYKKAFQFNNGKIYLVDRYNAACSYALAGDSKNAFYHLFYLAENPEFKYKDYNHIIADTDLKSLHSSSRWKPLIALVKANKDEAEKYLDKTLVTILDSIYNEDQKYRKQIGTIEKEYGRGSKAMKKHWELIRKKDSVNLIKVKQILDTRGWLGSKIVGEQGNATLFLVIQHADLKTQLQYLPMMRKAVQQGNAKGSDLALLEDRTALRQGKQQIYGSQIGRDPKTGEYFVSPIRDPETVNKRRAEVGLEPIENYISFWGITWDVKKHKARIEKLEKEKQ